MKPSAAGRLVAGRVIAGIEIVTVGVGINRRPSLGAPSAGLGCAIARPPVRLRRVALESALSGR